MSFTERIKTFFQTKKTKWLVGGGLIILLLLIVIIWGAQGGTSNPIGSEITVQRVTDNGQKTSSATVSVPYTSDSSQFSYVNISIDFNKDGSFSDYKVDSQTQSEWIVNNLSTRVLEKEGNRFGFQLVDLQVDERRDLPATVVLSKDQLAKWADESAPNAVFKNLHVSQVELDEIGQRMQRDPTGEGDTGFGGKFGAKALAHDDLPDQPPTEGAGPGGGGGQGAAPAAQNVQPPPPKDYDVFHADVPDITQGLNECVPTSTANSLLWLVEKYKFKDKLDMSGPQIIAELKNDMKWAAASGVRTDDNFLPGKEAFVKRHNLPLITHRLGEKFFDLNIVTTIYEELKKGQDVELVFEFGRYDAQGNYTRTGGHMVTAVGARRIGNSVYLDIHDPLSPGPGTLDIYKIDGTRVIDYAYQGNDVTYIRTAFAESPVEQPVVAPPAKVESPPSKPADTTSTPTTQSGETSTTTTKILKPITYAPSNYYDETKVAMKVLVLDGKKYPLYQFYGYDDPSDCSAKHYHSSMVGTPVYSLDYEPKLDPEPTGCGFGQIDKLTVDRVILTSDEFNTLYDKIQKLRLGS